MLCLSLFAFLGRKLYLGTCSARIHSVGLCFLHLFCCLLNILPPPIISSSVLWGANRRRAQRRKALILYQDGHLHGVLRCGTGHGKIICTKPTVNSGECSFALWAQLPPFRSFLRLSKIVEDKLQNKWETLFYFYLFTFLFLFLKIFLQKRPGAFCRKSLAECMSIKTDP